MKIGFFGDSYCELPTRNCDLAWPNKVGKLLNADTTNECISGDCLWHTFLYLEESIKNFDVVIICVSDPIRSPNHYRVPTIGPNFDEVIANKRMNKEEIEKYREYTKLQDRFKGVGYEYAAQIGVLYKIDELIGKHNKKAIILPSFENSLQGYTFKNASVANINLNEGVKNKVKRPISFNNDGSSIIINHLQEKENQVLAKEISDFINNNDYKLEFNLKKHFNYLYN